MGNGEIARYEQYLLFPQYFQKACLQGRQKVSLCGNGLTHSHTMTPFDAPEKQAHLLSKMDFLPKRLPVINKMVTLRRGV